MSNSLKPCQCGYGDHWYCYGNKLESHEFNRGDQPMARYQVDREPEAKVYGHISGKYAVARIHSDEPGNYKQFRYSAGGKEQAFSDAIKFVVDSVERRPEVQLDLFELG